LQECLKHFVLYAGVSLFLYYVSTCNDTQIMNKFYLYAMAYIGIK